MFGEMNEETFFTPLFDPFFLLSKMFAHLHLKNLLRSLIREVKMLRDSSLTFILLKVIHEKKHFLMKSAEQTKN